MRSWHRILLGGLLVAAVAAAGIALNFALLGLAQDDSGRVGKLSPRAVFHRSTGTTTSPGTSTSPGTTATTTSPATTTTPSTTTDDDSRTVTNDGDSGGLDGRKHDDDD